MQTTEKPNYKKFDLESDKPFFAAYLNTAKQNVFIIVRDISESLGLGFDLSNDDNMMNAAFWNFLKTNKEPEITQRIIDKLERQFPYANYLVKNYAFYVRKERTIEPNDYYEVFNMLIKQMLEYRNYYTHAVHKVVGMDKSIIIGMQMIYDASRREVKKRFALKTEDVNHLVRLSSRKVNGKSEAYEPEDFKYRFAVNDFNVTEKGFAFFVCMWLQRKNAQEFLKKLEGFKRSELPKFKATLETFSFYCLRVPQPKLTSDNTKEGLLLDMVNELKRCPKELYPLLNDADREKFKTIEEDKGASIEEEYEAMPILKRNDNRFFYFALRFLETQFKTIKFQIDLGNYCFHVYDQEIEGEVRKRRWIKRMTAFGNLEDFADDNRPTAWKEKIQKLEDRKMDNSDVYVTETTPHFHINGHNIGLKIIDKYEDLRKNNKIWPQLPVFDKNNVAKPNPTKPSNEKPDYWLSLYELTAIAFYHLLQQKVGKGNTAEAIINNHRRNIIDFFKAIENKEIKAGLTDEKLIQELNKRNLEKSFIPKAIIKFLTSKDVETFETKAQKKLDEILKETEDKLRSVEKQKVYFDKKPGTKDYIEMKCGNMADFLARDMIKLQKPIGKQDGKANGTEFQLLQAKLAYFGVNKETLKDTFKLCNLIETDNKHPFLSEINLQHCVGILDFYIIYLKLRKDYIEQCRKNKKFNDYHFLKLGERRRSSGQEYIIKLAKELKEDTIMNIPRALFLKPILNLLSELSPELATKIKNLPRVNTAYVIEKYFTEIEKDKPQEFYNYKKSYEFLNKLFDNRGKGEIRDSIEKQYFDTKELAQITIKTNWNPKDEKLPEKLQQALGKLINKRTEKLKISNDKKPQIYRLSDLDLAKKKKTLIEETKKMYWLKYKDFTESEKQIRLAKTCDIVLFMLADEIFRKEFVVDKGQMKNKNKEKPQSTIEIGEGYKLSEIKPNANEGFLSLQTRVELKLNNKTIVKETIKIKNYGDFRGMLKDRRISSLLPYIKDDTIQFEALQKELEIYESARMEVFERIYQFEKHIIAKKKLQKDEKGMIDHKFILKSLLPETDKRFEIIKELRNAFCHSNYPVYDLFKSEIDGSGFNTLKNYTTGNEEIRNKSVALQFKNLINKYYDELTLA